ncbi:MAG TPA: nucleoside diphosphate kinase regulator [Flavisolibacter sp.]|nr:nucleoside diphosphate kinase regulator [Flavisolibacter sp.]
MQKTDSKTDSRLVLAKQDYEIIMFYIRRGLPTITFNRQDAEELESELKRAKVVDQEELPDDVVRLNSKVTVKEENANKVMELTVVTPEKANIKQRLISIMSPIGTALIGFRKGQQVKWKVPSGKKTFTIMDVQNLYG